MRAQHAKSRLGWYWIRAKLLAVRYRRGLEIALLFLIPVIIALVLLLSGILEVELPPLSPGDDVTGYIVDTLCPRCGKPHRIANDLRIDGGPAEGGNLAELYPAGRLPPELAELLGDLVWCDALEEYIRMGEPAWVRLTPGAGGQGPY